MHVKRFVNGWGGVEAQSQGGRRERERESGKTKKKKAKKSINIKDCIRGTVDFDTHTQLLFEHGSFDGITIKYTAPTNAGVFGKKGRYFWFNSEQLEKLFYPFGPLTGFIHPFVYSASKYANNDAYMIRHYRNGEYLGRKRIKVWNTGNGTHARVEP